MAEGIVEERLECEFGGPAQCGPRKLPGEYRHAPPARHPAATSHNIGEVAWILVEQGGMQSSQHDPVRIQDVDQRSQSNAESFAHLHGRAPRRTAGVFQDAQGLDIHRLS